MKSFFKFYFFILVFIFTGAGLIFAQEAVYYISPNGDGVQDKLSVPFSISDSRFINFWHFIVTDAVGNKVFEQGEDTPKIEESAKNWRTILKSFFKSKQSVNIPSKIVWAGTRNSGERVPDGVYYFYFESEDDSGNYAQTSRCKVIVDTVAPAIKISDVPAQDKYFGASGKSTFTIKQTPAPELSTASPVSWEGEITNDDSGGEVRAYSWQGSAPDTVVWDGKDDKGFFIADGKYKYTVSAADAAGNKAQPASLDGINFKTTVPDVQIGRSYSEIAPDGGKTKTQVFNIKMSNVKRSEIESWIFSVVQTSGADVKEGAVKEWNKITDKIEWDGKLKDGSTAQGSFKGRLVVKFADGSESASETPSFISGAAPIASASTTPPLFSPDGDNDNDNLTISLSVQDELPVVKWSFIVYDPVNKKPFWTQGADTDIPQKLSWNGKGDNGELVESAMNYPYTFSITDSQEQSASADGEIDIDVLVIREGNQLRIRVPAIIFRANNADFVSKADDKKRGLDQKVIDNNVRVLSRIVDILNKFGDYKVKIEGHANSETGTEKEEVNELIPLSQKRADFIKEWLVERGIKSSRLTTEGVGGRRPVMKNRKDRDNWWKNRRVEFILEK